MTELIDPEEFPFTTQELFDAGCRFLPIEAARLMADHLTDCGPELIDARTTRRAGWRAAGIPNADTHLLGGWGYPDELLPAVASLSGDAEARARRLMEHQWEARYLGRVHELQWTAAEAAGLIPSREEFVRQAKRAAESSGENELLQSGLAVRLPRLPPPTAEMHVAAEAERTAHRLAWEAQVEQFRGSNHPPDTTVADTDL